MKLHELVHLAAQYPELLESEVRIGDQVESGPYLHASVGGVFRGTKNEIILTANDDEVWRDETRWADQRGGRNELPCLWKPS